MNLIRLNNKLITFSQGFIGITPLVNNINFGTGFNVQYVRTMVIDSNGKIYLGGDFISYQGVSTPRIVRLNADGSRDTDFNVGTGFDSTSVNSIVIDSNGKILVGGGFATYNGTNSNKIVRLNTDGTIDSGFTSYIQGIPGVRTMAIDSNNKIYVAGDFTSFNGSPQNRLIRLNDDGTKDTGFDVGTGFNLGIYSLKIDSNGKLLVGGGFTTYNSSSVPANLIRLNTDGTIDSTFNNFPGFNSYVLKVECDLNDKIYVTGLFTQYSGTSQNYIIRLNTDGSKDTGFDVGTGLNANAAVVIFDSTGQIYISGAFTTYKSVTERFIMKLNPDGSKDTSFDNNTLDGFNFQVMTVKINSDGKIIAGGQFTTYRGDSANYIIALNPDGTRFST